jgi:hypothetical protein
LIIQKTYLTSSGLSAMSDARNIYAFTNLLDGVELYAPVSLDHQRSIPQAIDRLNNVALGLVIIANTYIVVGSTCGVIWVYDQKAGSLLARSQTPTLSRT